MGWVGAGPRAAAPDGTLGGRAAEAMGGGVREEGRRPGGAPGGVRETPGAEVGLPAAEAGTARGGNGFAVGDSSTSEVPQLAHSSARGGL
jgi:hypothetical protein